jgi:deazaflavin-dependent oxidoreductase (nitroreductase family)
VSDWNQQVIDEFRANEGRVGGMFEGAPMIIIHHLGAKTGVERETPLVYFAEDDGQMIIVASKGGAPENPAWYYNLKANPTINVEVGAEKFPVTVDEVTGDERDQVWKRIVAERPGFGEYQEKTSRLIPVLRLTPAA